MRKAEAASPGFPSAKSMRSFISFARRLVSVAARGDRSPAATKTEIDSNPVSVRLRRHFIASLLNSRDWRGSPLDHQLFGRGFLHFVPRAAGVKQSSQVVPETPRALRAKP